VVGGLRLHHLDYGGEGDPIVLVHGVLGQAWSWQGVAPELTRHGRVVAVDLRGYGDSQWSAAGDYATASFASDLSGLANQHGWDRIRLVGFSLGGLVGLALWEQHRRLLERLVMIDLPPVSAKADTEIPPVVMAVSDHHAALAAESSAAPRAPHTLIEMMASHGWRPGPDGMLIRKHDPFFAQRWPFRAENWWDTVDRIDIPLLFVHAADSQVCSAGQAQDVVARAKSGRLATITDSGHLVPLEQPQQLVRHVVEFLEEG
jgi:pimeloyl-ACP methyl ester carboxylesterase